jgi:hypothetical protein
MKVQLLIEMNEQNQITVNGPINNKMLCYGMLDCARDAIKDFADNAAKGPHIALAQPGDVPDALRDRRLSFDANGVNTKPHRA